jgi:hypothetical protein
MSTMRSVLLGVVGAAALTATLAAALAAAPSAVGAQDPAVVESVMRAQYGAQKDPHAGCWIHHAADFGSYCMKPVQQHLIGMHDGPRLYLLAEGLPMDGNGAIEEIGAHAAPGLVGAFAVELNGPTGDAAPKWRVSAASQELAFGSFGRAGVTDAKFAQLGPDYYGWTFVSGGTWQGVNVGLHVILAPRGSRFVNLSTIPSMTEQDQGHRFDIAIDATAQDVKVYPLVVTKWRIVGGKVGAAAIETVTVPFDERRWSYRWDSG